MMKRTPTDTFAPRHVYRVVKKLMDWFTLDVARQWFEDNKEQWVWLVEWLRDASYDRSLGGSRITLTRQESKDVTLRQLRSLAGEASPDDEADDAGKQGDGDGDAGERKDGAGIASHGASGGTVHRMDRLPEEGMDYGPEEGAGRPLEAVRRQGAGAVLPPLGPSGSSGPGAPTRVGRSVSTGGASDGGDSIPEDLPAAVDSIC